MPMERERALEQLRGAFGRRELTLYLGAGVSVASGLPGWERLVLAMVFDAIQRRKLEGWRPLPNYLYAIAEWRLRQGGEPLEITARKLRMFYGEDQQEAFREQLHRLLYGAFVDEEGRRAPELSRDGLRAGNPTLRAVARLCERDPRGVEAVITYNYDDLLEMALGHDRAQPVFGEERPAEGRLPIYHVHGFVPLEGAGSPPGRIVFTEDQYHLAAGDPYSWSNLVQIRAMSASVGLMVGLSLSDRNMRRLLDAVQRAPVRTRNFALLQRPATTPDREVPVDAIDTRAREFLDRFAESGVKGREGVLSPIPGLKSRAPMAGKGPRYAVEIRGIVSAVESLEEEQQTFVLEQLGVTPIWYDRHEEIPDLLAQVEG